MPISAILLDLDGTLVDTNHHHVEAYVRVLARFGYEVERERIDRHVGLGGDKLVPALIGEDGDARHGKAIRDAASREFVDVIAAGESFEMFSGARDLIAELRRRGLATAIATSSDEELLDGIFGSTGYDLREDVDASLTKSDVSESKPAADVIFAALEKLGAPAAEAVLVGDTVYDFQAASRAGVDGIGVTTWVWPAEDLKRAGAGRVFADVAELLARLDEVLGPA
jgi:HAD superfamily hydrolase (TIGR01549 family)